MHGARPSTTGTDGPTSVRASGRSSNRRTPATAAARPPDRYHLGAGGSSTVGRAAAFQAACRGFEPRLPLQYTATRFAAADVRGVTGQVRLVVHDPGEWG